MSASGPQISPLSSAESHWLAERLREGSSLILRYNGPESPATLADLDDAFERWSQANEPDKEEPEHVVSALGAVLGAHLTDLCALDWRMIADEFGMDLAVVGQPGDIVIAPVSVTAKRIEAGETRFFENFGRAVQAKVAEIRGS